MNSQPNTTHHAEKNLAQADWGQTDWLATGARAFSPEATARYSRFVSSLRVILPVGAAFILMVLFILPNVNGSNVEPKKATASDATMKAPHYTSRDDEGRPYAVDADEARQHQGAAGVTDLANPKAVIDLNNGQKINADAKDAQYDQNTGKLNVQNGLVIRRSDGATFTTDEAHVDINGKNAEGNKPVLLQGNFGEVRGQGFKALDGGKTFIFTGESSAKLKLGGGGLPSAPQKEQNPPSPQPQKP